MREKCKNVKSYLKKSCFKTLHQAQNKTGVQYVTILLKFRETY